MSDRSLRGRLLVARPQLLDPNFFRTVVLLLDHNEQGALGVVLNRPSRVRMAGILPEWSRMAAEREVVFLGGPVERQAALGLARVPPEQAAGAGIAILEAVVMVDLHRRPETMEAEVEAVRVFSGYAGWGGGQLEREISEQGWVVVEATAEDVLTSQPAALWYTAQQREALDEDGPAPFPPEGARN